MKNDCNFREIHTYTQPTATAFYLKTKVHSSVLIITISEVFVSALLHQPQEPTAKEVYLFFQDSESNPAFTYV